MNTITSTHPCKRPLFFVDVEVGGLFISHDKLYVKIRELVEEDDVYFWRHDEYQMFNAVCISGDDIGRLGSFKDDVEVALLKKDIQVEFDPDTDLQRWV